MKNLLISFLNHIIPNAYYVLWFRGTLRAIDEDFDIYNLDALTEDELYDLAGNLIIDYNDRFDTEHPGDSQLWDTYLKPISDAYLIKRPN